MVISYNSQLGLRFREDEIKVNFLKQILKSNEDLAAGIKLITEAIEKGQQKEDGSINFEIDDSLKYLIPDGDDRIEVMRNERRVRDFVTKCVGDKVLIDDDDSSYYFICDSVYKAAELIRIKEYFSGRTLKDIKLGKYTYLMGKHQMVRFVCVIGGIKGFYYDDEKNTAFEWGIEMENGDYYFDGNYSAEFTKIMKILSFVELGDIEVKMLEAGRNNGGKKNVDKITNTSEKTVYVVDSSWNQIIIRTTGFAVRGHFRLQPCGESMKDRKLIWINAFEKHGYKRRPTGEIVHQYPQ